MNLEDSHLDDPHRDSVMEDILSGHNHSVVEGSGMPFDPTEAQEELDRILRTPSVGAGEESIDDQIVENGNDEVCVEKLKEVAQFIEENFQSKVECVFMYDSEQRPFLKVKILIYFLRKSLLMVLLSAIELTGNVILNKYVEAECRGC